MPNWNDLAMEIKLMVINEIDPNEYDLLDFRLANKECNELSKKLFAETYFTVRRHYVDEESLQALVDISKDDFLVKYVKTIQLSALQGHYDVSYWSSNREPVERHPGIVDSHVTFNKYYDRTEHESLLREALLNLKTQRTPFTIGIDRRWRPLESDSDLGAYGWLAPSSWNLGKSYVKPTEWDKVAENERIAFKMITSIAEEVRLPVKGLKVSLYDHYLLLLEEGKEEWLDYNNRAPPKEPCDPELVEDIYKYLAKFPKMDVDIDLTTGDWRDDDYRVADYRFYREEDYREAYKDLDQDLPYQSMKVNYDRRSKTLTIDKIDTRDAEEFMRPWLSSIQLRSLRLTNMHIEDGCHVRMFVGDHRTTLKKLRITDCTLENDGGWEQAIHSIATISALEYLSFTNPSVKYNWKEFFNFHFGVNKCVKLSYCDDVQQQLLYDLELWEESGVVAAEHQVHGDQVEEDSEQEESEEEESEEEDQEEEDEDGDGNEDDNNEGERE